MEMVRAARAEDGAAGDCDGAQNACAPDANGITMHVEGDVTIVSHHANIKDARYDVDFFKSFDIVLNGLDNVDARRHVNR